MRLLALLALLEIFVITVSISLTLNCNYSSNTEYQVIGKIYMCDVKNFSVTNDDDIVSEVTGTHEDGMAKHNVKLLKIEQQQLPFMPRNLHNFFPNLEGLIIDTSKLKVITKNDLNSFPKLKLLFIGHNKIDNLPGDLFEGNPDIEWLVYIDNYTKHIAGNLLQQVPRLQFANFQRNTCINRKAVNADEIALLKTEIENKCF